MPDSTAFDSGDSARDARPPRLLVSVRSATEALAALEGGADILDVKEPSRGSLGMANAATIREVAGTAGILALAANDDDAGEPGRAATVRRIPISAALGELAEWKRLADIPALPPLAYAKLGPAGMGENRGWVDRWLRVRKAFDDAAGREFGWIAVAYVDWQAAQAPPPAEVFAAAVATGCAGVLFDTHGKSAGNLWAHSSPAELREMMENHRRAESPFLVAAAGGLNAEALSRFGKFRPDIVAIRTAACARGDRNGMITSIAVARFRDALASRLS